MTKNIKRLINFLISCILLSTTLFSSSFVSHAQAAANEGKQKTFLPFRNDLVKYVTSHASDKNNVIQSQWLRLFAEERSNENWSDTYYCQYTLNTGETLSSQGEKITYNPNFDTFLFSTITANTDFISNWITQDAETFQGYCDAYKEHPDFCDAIVQVTADGFMLGDGYKQENNEFEYGFEKKDFWDLKVLAILSTNWRDLTVTQQDWCKTYLPYLVQDYVDNGENAIAAKSNNQDLYNLMAISAEGFKSEKGQEFFDYVIENSEVNFGDLLKNIVNDYDKSSDIKTADIYSQTDLSTIFLGDADCDCTDDSLGDNDFDWMAYTICFSKEKMWERLREFIDANEDAQQQKQQWLLRYYRKNHDNENNDDDDDNDDENSDDIIRAIENQGKTIYEYGPAFFVPGCNKKANSDVGFQCYYGHAGFGSYTSMKPVGVSRISFSYSGNYACQYQWSVVDTSTGKVIDSCGYYASSPSINLPTKYIWSSTIRVSVNFMGINPAKGNVGEGSCYSGYDSPIICWTYVPLSHCDINNHTYEYTYTFSEGHSSCTATGICRYCGDTIHVTDTTVQKTEDDDFYKYTANFAHTTIDPKTDTVAKSKGVFVYDSNSPLISGKTSNHTSTSKTYRGSGFTLHTATSTECSLMAGAIKPGAKSITISTLATTHTYTLVDKYGRVLFERQIQSGDYVHGIAENASYTIDLNDYSDKQLDGAYVKINLYAFHYVEGGYYMGQTIGATANVALNSITISY